MGSAVAASGKAAKTRCDAKRVVIYFSKPISEMSDAEKYGAIEDLKDFALRTDGFLRVRHIHMEDVVLDGHLQTEVSGWATLHYMEVP